MTTSHTPRYRWTWQSRNKVYIQYEISVDKAKRIKLKQTETKRALGIDHSSYSNVMQKSMFVKGISISSTMESFSSLLLTI